MSTALTIIIALITLIVILIAVIAEMHKQHKETKYKIVELERELADREINISYLVKHSQELASILQKNSEVQNKINEAKTDEEINDIVAAVIAANNDRVQNNKAKTK